MAQKPLADFEVDIPKVSALLADNQEMQAFFDALTPGYQREWARFILVAPQKRRKHVTSK